MVIFSLIAFWAGEFVNSYVLAKMKIMTRGQMLWTRTIGSTIAGQLVDSLIINFGFHAGSKGNQTMKAHITAISAEAKKAIQIDLRDAPYP